MGLVERWVFAIAAGIAAFFYSATHVGEPSLNGMTEAEIRQSTISLIKKRYTADRLSEQIQRQIDVNDIDMAISFDAIADDLGYRVDRNVARELAEARRPFSAATRNTRQCSSGVFSKTDTRLIATICSLLVEFTPVGSVRTLSGEALSGLTGRGVDALEVSLAAFDLSLLAATGASGGLGAVATTTVRSGLGVVRASLRLNRISRPLKSQIKREVDGIINPRAARAQIEAEQGRWFRRGTAEQKEIGRRASKTRLVTAMQDLQAASKNMNSGAPLTGSARSVQALKWVKSFKDITELRRLSDVFEARTIGVMTLAGVQSVSELGRRPPGAKLIQGVVGGAVTLLLTRLLKAFSNLTTKRSERRRERRSSRRRRRGTNSSLGSHQADTYILGEGDSQFALNEISTEYTSSEQTSSVARLVRLRRIRRRL